MKSDDSDQFWHPADGPRPEGLNRARRDFNGTPAERRALAAINHGGEPPSTMSRVTSDILLLVIAAMAVSGGLRGIIWMWS